mmetsp:Transcript_2312/g.5388  ORF Transcript_2312/g.5388 Transcript_2312/m.5388 type:complete len:233 (-) Transcript_2312:2-700(-)
MGLSYFHTTEIILKCLLSPRTIGWIANRRKGANAYPVGWIFDCNGQCSMSSHGMSCDRTQVIFSDGEMLLQKIGEFIGNIIVHVIMSRIWRFRCIDVESCTNSQIIAIYVRDRVVSSRRSIRHDNRDTLLLSGQKRPCPSFLSKVGIVTCQPGEPKDHWHIRFVVTLLSDVCDVAGRDEETKGHGSFGRDGCVGDAVVGAAASDTVLGEDGVGCRHGYYVDSVCSIMKDNIF